LAEGAEDGALDVVEGGGGAGFGVVVAADGDVDD
jgi:hypothetical protein